MNRSSNAPSSPPPGEGGDKTGPVESLKYAVPLLLATVLTILGMALLAVVTSAVFGVAFLSFFAAVSTLVGICALFLSDLIPYWRRNDDERKTEKTEEVEGAAAGEPTVTIGHWATRRKALYAKISRKERERQAERDDRARERAAEREKERLDREREDARETAARDDFLIFGHGAVLLGAVLFLAAFLTPHVTEWWLETVVSASRHNFMS